MYQMNKQQPHNDRQQKEEHLGVVASNPPFVNLLSLQFAIEAGTPVPCEPGCLRPLRR